MVFEKDFNDKTFNFSRLPLLELRGKKQSYQNEDDDSDEGSSSFGGGGLLGSEFLIPPELRHKQQELTTAGHAQKFGKGKIGQRRPPEVKNSGPQQGRGLKSHPAFLETPIGAADRNMTNNARINSDSEAKATERAHELNPALKKALNLAKQVVQRFIPPRLER